MKTTAAAVAGILPNDRIIGVNDAAISSIRQVQSAIKAREGESIVLSIIRNDEVKKLTTTTSEDGIVGGVL